MATSAPLLAVPNKETVTVGSTLSVTGIEYTDSFAAANPGAMYLRVWDSAGLLSATDAAGAAVPGSATRAITLRASYADITAALASLRYAAAATAGSDTIHFDLWDQAGMETTGPIPVSVTAGGATAHIWTGAVSGDWNAAGNWSAGAAPAGGDHVQIPGGTPNSPVLSGATLTGQAINLADGDAAGGAAGFSNVTLGAGTVLRDVADNTLPQPAVTLGGTFTVAAGATLAAGNNSLLILHTASGATPDRLVNQGSVVADGGNLNIDTGGTVVNNGEVVARNSGGIGFDFGQSTNAMAPETILNAGTIAADGGSLFINGTVHGGTLAYGSTGTVVLEQTNALADGARISGFGPNDTIQLYLVNADSLSFDNGVLTVMSGTTAVESLPMSGSDSNANFRMTYRPGAQFSNVISYVPDPVVAGPAITAPVTTTVAVGGTVGISGVSVADRFAKASPGSMALNVTDTSGALGMTGADGKALPGSGTGAIHDTGTFSQINAALATLTYAAAGAGSATVTVNVWDQAGKAANRTIAVTGRDGSVRTAASGPVVSGTPGDDTIVSNLNNAMIDAGSGNDTIFACGTGDTITATGGDNVVQAFAGGNRITTGGGADTVRIAGSGSTLDAGSGTNRIEDSGGGNTLVLPVAGQGTDNVYGYVLSANDLFDLRGALANAGWNGALSTLSDYLSLGTVNDGADTTVSVAAGGRGAGAVVATLHGNGAVSLANFLPHTVLS